MKIEDFENQYTDDKTFFTTWLPATGHRRSGVIIGRGTSAKGVKFVYVDNFYNRVAIESLTRIKGKGN